MHLTARSSRFASIFDAAKSTSLHARGILSPRRSVGTLLLILGALSLVCGPLAAKEKSPLEIALTAQRVVRDAAAGTDSLSNDPAVEPGDIVQYTATYRNVGANLLHNLAPTLPIPAGMEFIAGSAVPAPALASTDGKTFEPYPIRRAHKLRDGREILTEVPASAYRALRWGTSDLPASTVLTLSARARVTVVAFAAR